MSLAVQRIKKKLSSQLAVAIRYYSIMSILGEWKLTPRQIELLAFTAVRGTMSSGGAKETFIQTFNSSMGTIANMKGELIKKKLLIEKDKRVVVNPQVCLNFNSPVILQLHLNVEA